MTNNLAGSRGIILLALDGLRSDRLSCAGHHRETTPFLDSLTRNALFCENSHATSPTSLPSYISMFTGLTPQYHGAACNHAWFDGRANYLTKELKRRGFRTAGVSTHNPFLTLERGFIRGFDRYIRVIKSNRRLHAHRNSILARFEAAASRVGGGISRRLIRCRDYLRGETRAFQALRREYEDFYLRNDLGGRRIVSAAHELCRDMARHPEPFFIFVDILDAHSPFLPPAGYRDAFGDVSISDNLFRALYTTQLVKSGRITLDDEERSTLEKLYDGGVRYVDSLVEELFDRLNRDHLLEGVTVLILGDHGEMLNEFDALMGHGAGMHPGVLRVPLLVWNRDFTARRESRAASIADAFPTILDLRPERGEELPYGARNLFDAHGPPRSFVVAEAPTVPFAEKNYGHLPGYLERWIFAERAWITEDHFFVWRANGMHRLHKPVDPRRNFAAVDPETVVRAIRELQDWYLRGPAQHRPLGLEHFEFPARDVQFTPSAEEMRSLLRDQDRDAIEDLLDAPR